MTGLEIPMWAVLLLLMVLVTLLGLPWECYWTRSRRRRRRHLLALCYGVSTINEIIEEESGEAP